MEQNSVKFCRAVAGPTRQLVRRLPDIELSCGRWLSHLVGASDSYVKGGILGHRLGGSRVGRLVHKQLRLVRYRLLVPSS